MGHREQLLVSVFLSSHSLSATVCSDKLILSCSCLNVVSSSSDPQDISIQTLDFPSCCGAALVAGVYGSRPGELTQ